MQDAGVDLEHEVLQLWIKEEIEMIGPVGVSTRQTSVVRLGRV
jgi:hypothetical protein